MEVSVLLFSLTRLSPWTRLYDLLLKWKSLHWDLQLWCWIIYSTMKHNITVVLSQIYILAVKKTDQNLCNTYVLKAKQLLRELSIYTVLACISVGVVLRLWFESLSGHKFVISTFNLVLYWFAPLFWRHRCQNLLDSVLFVSY